MYVFFSLFLFFCLIFSFSLLFSILLFSLALNIPCGVLCGCVKEIKLRIIFLDIRFNLSSSPSFFIVSSGYLSSPKGKSPPNRFHHSAWNVQFPRAIREEGAKYVVEKIITQVCTKKSRIETNEITLVFSYSLFLAPILWHFGPLPNKVRETRE